MSSIFEIEGREAPGLRVEAVAILTFTCSRMDSARVPLWTCARCLRAQQRRSASQLSALGASRARSFATSSHPKEQGEAGAGKRDGVTPTEEKELGALSRRLSEMAEETMDTGSKSDRKMMQDLGFSSDLKKQLEERIAQSSFNSENQQALSQANLPVRDPSPFAIRCA
jgi:hypothetical protein